MHIWLHVVAASSGVSHSMQILNQLKRTWQVFNSDRLLIRTGRQFGRVGECGTPRVFEFIIIINIEGFPWFRTKNFSHEDSSNKLYYCSTMSLPAAYHVTPITLFRISSSRAIALRQFKEGATNYDVVLTDGKVPAKFLDLENYTSTMNPRLSLS